MRSGVGTSSPPLDRHWARAWTAWRSQAIGSVGRGAPCSKLRDCPKHQAGRGSGQGRVGWVAGQARSGPDRCCSHLVQLLTTRFWQGSWAPVKTKVEPHPENWTGVMRVSPALITHALTLNPRLDDFLKKYVLIIQCLLHRHTDSVWKATHVWAIC